jgi:DtxR family transcriptional regulator, manganese transport regulator
MKKNSLQAEPFIATRTHHVSELAEDYVELISDLILNKGEAKICDIAQHLGVSHVTVIRTIDRLKKKGLIDPDPNQPVKLTSKGLELAIFCKERHQFLLNYLITLGVPENVAKIDVEGMEHHISQTTMQAFQRHLKKIT